MKNICSLLIVVLLSFTAYGQQKKDNTITITTSLPATEAFTAWGKHLAANGYTIDKSDATFFTITTGPKDTSKYAFDYIINSSVNDQGQVQVKIKYRLKNGRNVPFTDWEYATAKTNALNVIFQDVSPVITSFGQYPVSYSVK